MTFLVSYIATAVIFLVLDLGWLSLTAGRIYQPEIGQLLLARPNLPVAALFYALYIGGVVFLAVLPNAAGPWWVAAAAGAILGLVAYGTYDLTNLATVNGWSPLVTVLDLAWGTVVTAIAAAGAHYVLRIVPFTGG